MTYKNFQPFHCHQQSLDSASTIQEFAKRELELETGVLCVTDHGYLGACREVYDTAKKNKLTPILGIEGYFRDDNCSIFSKHNVVKDPDNTYRTAMKYGHFCLHCIDQPSFEALVALVSERDKTAEAHGSERKPIFGWNDLEELGKYNITLSSGCLAGIIARHLLSDRMDVALEYYEKLRSIPKKGNFYVELFPQICDKNWVSGAFITLEDDSKLKYWSGKKVKTTKFEEITVSDLSKAFKKDRNVGKLIAIKNRRTWEEVPAQDIKLCEFIQDFIPNECSDFSPNGDVQLATNKFLYNLAQKYGDPIICSDDSHFAYPFELATQKAKLRGMGENFAFLNAHYRKNSQEAWEYFNKVMGMSEKEFLKMLDNNQEWSLKFKDFSFNYDVSLPKSFYPADTLQYLKVLINKHGKMDWSNGEMIKRLQEEIDLLYGNGTIDLLPYFFPIEELLSYCREQRITTSVGRGSVGGLLIANLLNISKLNPLKYDLSKDRFLTKPRIESGKFPDIDTDLGNPKLITEGNPSWLEKRFGKDNVIQIGTNNLIKLKTALRDVARSVYNEVPPDIEALSKSLPHTPQGVDDKNFIFGYRSEDGTEYKGLIDERSDLKQFAEKNKEIWNTAINMLSLKRSHGRHAAGWIIADRPISSFIPIITTNDDENNPTRCTQYNDDACEASGAVKYDLLGLNTLNDITNCIQMIQDKEGLEWNTWYTIGGIKVHGTDVIKHNGELLNIWDLPEDPAVFEDISEGRTETVFQLNTPGAQKWLKEFNHPKKGEKGKTLISSIMDIAIFTALDRKGALDAYVEKDGQRRNMLQEYAARARGKPSIGNIDFLDKELAETHGVMIFQEGLSKVYKNLTGCTGVEAESFREMVGKKKVEKMQQAYSKFIEKASEKVGKENAELIWQQILPSSGYSFNKIHSVEYGIMAYVCAYLKHYFPLEWWCGLLRNADKNKIGEIFWKHCKDFVKLPDIQHSQSEFVIKNDKIIAPLSMIHGVGENAHKELSENAPYKDIDDFCQKIANHKEKNTRFNPDTNKTRKGVSALNSGIVSKLIISGVMNSLFPSNLDLISKLEHYQSRLALALNKKRPDKIKDEYRNLDPLTIYQLRKSILPVYSTDLLPLLAGSNVEGISQKVVKLNNDGSSEMTMYSYFPQDPKIMSNIMRTTGSKSIKRVPFVSSDLLAQLNQDATLFENNILNVVVAAYVQTFTKFEYKDKKTGQRWPAYKFILDINNELIEFIKWPNYKTKENYLLDKDLEGSIIVALLAKTKETKPFAIEAITKIKEPLEKHDES
jgi:DNA polymerase III subunit alpha